MNEFLLANVKVLIEIVILTLAGLMCSVICDGIRWLKKASKKKPPQHDDHTN